MLTDVGFLKFEPPPECRHLTIFTDNDELFDGQQASTPLAYRLARKPGLKVVYKLPPGGLKDWNDVVQAERDAKNVRRLHSDAVHEDAEGEGDRQAVVGEEGRAEYPDVAG